MSAAPFQGSVFDGSQPPASAPPARRAPLVFALFAGGLAIGRALEGVLPSTLWFSLGTGACALALCARGWAVRFLLALALGAFAAGWFTLRLLEVPRDSLAHRLPLAGALAETVPMTLEGIVLRTPERLPEPRAELARYGFRGARPLTFPLRVLRVRTSTGGEEVSGVLRVFITGMEEGLLGAGRHVRVTGLGEALIPPRNPGEAHRRLRERQEGVVGRMRVPDPSMIEPLAPPESLAVRMGAALRDARETLRERARAILLAPDPPDDAGGGERALLAALVLGLSMEGEGAELRERFTRLGIVHLIAISGFHLLVLTGAALLLVRLTGDHGRWEAIVALALVGVYLLLVPSRPPVMRAGFMLLGMLGVEASGRRYDRVNTLAWIGVLALLLRPMDLWTLGFQLSYGLTAALLWIGGRTHGRLFGARAIAIPGGRPRRLAAWHAPVRAGLARQFSTSLLCWALATPLLMHSVGLFSPGAVLTTILLFPLIAALLVGGYAALGLGILIPALAEASSAILRAGATPVLGLAGWIDGLPGTSIRTPPISAAWAGAATLVVLYWLARARVREIAGWAGAGLVLAWLAVEVTLGTRLPSGTLLRADMLAVGDGTCILLRSGREAMLWDCGSRTRPIGRRTVPRAVRALGVDRMESALISHPDLDHFSALPELLDPLGIRRVYAGEAMDDAAARAPRSAVARVMQILHERGVEVVRLAEGDALTLGRATLTFLSPPPGAAWPDDNDHSLVARVEVTTDAGSRSLLLTGDVGRAAITRLLESRPDLRADAMELPHHGSANAPARELLVRTDPSVVLQSTGRERVGDARWAPFRAGRVWLTTESDGAAWVELRRDGSIRAGARRREAVTLR